MSVAIDHGVPVPARRCAGRHPILSFEEMRVGDSFAVTGDLSINSVRCAARYFRANKQPTWKFAVRKSLTETRCWRIA